MRNAFACLMICLAASCTQEDRSQSPAELTVIEANLAAMRARVEALERTVGPAGPPGAQGSDGARGEVGPEGPQGAVGPRGPVGPEGPAGATGAQGERGERGDRGAQGEPGARGLQGETGAQGPVGPVGSIGPQGAVGPRGERGERGPEGPKGDVGNVGPQGAVGPRGERGERGLDGVKGDTGPVGPAGTIGPAGPQGPAGPSGAEGAEGAKGDRGAIGPEGPEGAEGPEGPAGPPGPPGDAEPEPEIVGRLVIETVDGGTFAAPALPVYAFTLGLERSITSPTGGSGGAGSGRESTAPSFSELEVTLLPRWDAAIDVWRHLLAVTDARVVTLYVQDPEGAPGTEVKLVELRNTLVAAVSEVVVGDDRPGIRVALNFTSIDLAWDGACFGWNIATSARSTLGMCASNALDSAALPDFVVLGHGASAVAGEQPTTKWEHGGARAITSPVGGAGPRESSAISMSEVAVAMAGSDHLARLAFLAAAGTEEDVTLTRRRLVGASPVDVQSLALGETLVSGFTLQAKVAGEYEVLVTLNATHFTFTMRDPSAPATTETLTFDTTTQQAP